MARHRILIVGAPCSGRAWLAGRIHALTGIPVEPGGDGAPRHEWMRLADRAEEVARAADDADLVVLVRTPVWLRDLRALLRWPGSRERVGLRAALAAAHGWDRRELPRVLDVLRGHAGKVMACASSEDVRAVLERVFGLDGISTPAARGDPARG